MKARLGPRPRDALLTPTPPPDSRHHRRLIQEGLGCHIALDVLHGYLLSQVLTLQDRWGGERVWGQTVGNTHLPQPPRTPTLLWGPRPGKPLTPTS